MIYGWVEMEWFSIMINLRIIGELLVKRGGIPNSDLTSMVGDSNYIWIGSYYGIRQIDRRTKREEPMGFEYLFYNHPVYDLAINDFGVWIASRTGIYLYDKNNPQIMNALSIGDSFLDFPVSRVTSIHQEKIFYFLQQILEL